MLKQCKGLRVKLALAAGLEQFLEGSLQSTQGHPICMMKRDIRVRQFREAKILDTLGVMKCEFFSQKT